MAKSYVRFRGAGFWSKDTLLRIWLRLVALRLPWVSMEGADMAPLRDEWIKQSAGLFPGVMAPQLDELVDSEPKLRELIATCKEVMDELEQIGDDLSPQALSSLGFGRFDQPYSLNWIRNIHLSFIEILEERPSWGADDYLVLPVHQPPTANNAQHHKSDRAGESEA